MFMVLIANIIIIETKSRMKKKKLTCLPSQEDYSKGFPDHHGDLDLIHQTPSGKIG